MKLTIVVSDNKVNVDGVPRATVPLPLDLSQCGIPSNVWALQWKETAGWIEFVDNPDGSKPPNEPITVLPDWANACVDVYNAWTPYIPPPPPDQPTTTGTQSA
jgi:hypothetical protein